MNFVVKSDPEQAHLYRAACENAVRDVADAIDAEVPEVVPLPGFDAVNKENICRLFMHEVNRHRLNSKSQLLAGEITSEVDAWNQNYANYMEDLQGRVTVLLNLCPTLPDEDDHPVAPSNDE